MKIFLQKCNRHSTFKWEKENKGRKTRWCQWDAQMKTKKTTKKLLRQTVNFEIKFNTQQRLQSIVDLPSLSHFNVFFFFWRNFSILSFVVLSYTTNNKTTSNNNNINWKQQRTFLLQKDQSSRHMKEHPAKIYQRRNHSLFFHHHALHDEHLFFSLRFLVFSSLLRENRNWFSFPYLDIPPLFLFVSVSPTTTSGKKKQIPKTISEETPQKHKQSLQVPSKEIYYRFCVDSLFSRRSIFCFDQNTPTKHQYNTKEEDTRLLSCHLSFSLFLRLSFSLGQKEVKSEKKKKCDWHSNFLSFRLFNLVICKIGYESFANQWNVRWNVSLVRLDTSQNVCIWQKKFLNFLGKTRMKPKKCLSFHDRITFSKGYTLCHWPQSNDKRVKAK